MQTLNLRKIQRTYKEPLVLRGLKGKASNLFILLSSRYCNQNCISCLTDSSPDRKDTLVSPETIRTILDNLSSRIGIFQSKKLVRFSISGGEPMLNPDFIVVAVLKLKQMHARKLTNFVQIPVITNGTVASEELFQKLEPIKNLIEVHNSEDKFHEPSREIRQFRKRGFVGNSMQFASAIAYGKDHITVGMGRAYNLPTEELDVNFRCEAAGLKYKIQGNEIIPIEHASTARFMIDEKGNIGLCGFNGLTFANVLYSPLEDAIKRIEMNKEAQALMKYGPLGIAELRGVLDTAIEILVEKGPCAVCHSLKEGILQ